MLPIIQRTRATLPMPPEALTLRVHGSLDPGTLDLESARIVQEWRKVLRITGHPLDRMGTVLDYGCGCGWTTRHLAVERTGRRTVIAALTDPEAVEWLAAALPEVHAVLVGEGGATPIEPCSVDVAATHVALLQHDEAGQGAVLMELRRVLRPGGFLLVAMAGKSKMLAHLDRLDPSAREAAVAAIEARGVHHDPARRATVQTLAQAMGCWLDGLELVRWYAERLPDGTDLLLLRKR